MNRHYAGTPLYANAPQVPPHVEAAFNAKAAEFRGAELSDPKVKQAIGDYVRAETGVSLRGYADAMTSETHVSSYERHDF